MKRTSIYLDDEQDKLLRHLAIEEGRSFTDLVRRALDQYIERKTASYQTRATEPPRNIPDAEWRARFDALLDQVRAKADPTWTPEEMEADIDAARREVRRERPAHRQAPRA